MAFLRLRSFSSSLENIEVAFEAAHRVPASKDAFAMDKRRSIEEVLSCLSLSF